MKASKTQNLNLKQVINNTHPPVVLRFALGETSPAYEAGQVVGIANNQIVSFSETVTKAGVITQAVEANAGGVNVLIHGTVNRESLVIEESQAENAMKALAAGGIWAL